MASFFDVAQTTRPVGIIELFPDDDLGDYTYYFMLETRLQWPVQPVQIARSHYDEARDWCHQAFGPQHIQWAEAGWCIAFRDNNAAFQFKLRWC